MAAVSPLSRHVGAVWPPRGRRVAAARLSDCGRVAGPLLARLRLVTSAPRPRPQRARPRVHTVLALWVGARRRAANRQLPLLGVGVQGARSHVRRMLAPPRQLGFPRRAPRRHDARPDVRHVPLPVSLQRRRHSAAGRLHRISHPAAHPAPRLTERLSPVSGRYRVHLSLAVLAVAACRLPRMPRMSLKSSRSRRGGRLTVTVSLLSSVSISRVSRDSCLVRQRHQTLQQSGINHHPSSIIS